MQRWAAIGVVVAVVVGLWLAVDRPSAPRRTPHNLAARKRLPPPESPAEPPAPSPPPPPAVPVDPSPPAPHIQAGKLLTIHLSEPPQPWYGRPQTDENDAHYAELVGQLSGGQAVYDASLGKAARELVYQTTELGDIVPSDVREFVVASAGGVAADTTFQQVRTTSDGPEPLKQAIEAVVAARGDPRVPVRVGVGEVYRHGLPMPRHIGVVGTRLGVALRPVAVRAEPGTTIALSGRLLADWKHLEALVLRADGSEAELSVTQQGDQIALQVPAGTALGPLDVDLDGEGPAGPGKLVQLRFWVGQNPPQSLTTHAPADETRLKSADEAEAYVLALVNRDRAAYGLPALGWDRRLAAVARQHSQDMRDHGFFGHLSPSSGLPSDRLKRAGYKNSAHAENVAHNSTLSEAEAGLMHSLGHRRNLLSRDVPVLGVGVAMQGEGAKRRFWVTQLFARPALDWSPAQIEGKVAQLLQDQRAAKGLGALAVDGPLSEVARSGAEQASSGALDGVSRRALDQAKERGLLQGRLHAFVLLTGDLEKIEFPAEVFSDSALSVGIGGASEQGDGGRLAVILLTLERVGP